MSAIVDSIRNEVKANTNLKDSAILLLQKLFAAVQAGIDSGDMDELQGTLDELKNSDVALATAITTNTPAEPAPAPTAPVSQDGSTNADGSTT